MLEGIKNLGKDLYRAYRQWQKDDGSHMAASVSFYMAVSFLPLLLVLISATGFLLRFSGWGKNARRRLLELVADQTAPLLTNQLEAVLSNVQQKAVVGGPVGLATLIVASIMWEVGRRVLAAIVIGSRFSVYGVVGAFIAIMLWTFYAVTILFLGAEYIQVFCSRCRPDRLSTGKGG